MIGEESSTYKQLTDTFTSDTMFGCYSPSVVKVFHTIIQHTSTEKYPDSIVGKRQRPQAFLIYSYVISTAIGTWHSVLQSQHTDKCGIIAAHCCWCIVHNIWYSVVLLFVRGQQQGMPHFRVSTSCGLLWKQVNIQWYRQWAGPLSVGCAAHLFCHSCLDSVVQLCWCVHYLLVIC